jgi:hypothetical protein
MRKGVGLRAARWFAAAGAIFSIAVAAESYFPAQVAPSESAAEILQKKIDTIKASHAAGNASGRRSVEVSEVELESYVLYHLRDDIPARIDALDVQLTDGAVAADTKLTFAPNATGNVVTDLLISGTHSFFIKGKLAASAKRGKFDLESVKIDGIPVPNILIETLVNKFVKPKYPDVDLNEPFTMPWGIESLVITPGKTVIGY